MRRLLVAVTVAVVLGSGLTAAPVGAATSGKHSVVTLPFSGTTTFDLATPPCSFAHQVYDATVTTRREPLSLHIDGCATLATNFPFSGTFVLAGNRLGQLQGTLAGTVTTPSSSSCAAGLVPGSLDFTLTPTSATRSFRHATGTIHLVGTWCSPAVPNVAGPVDGTLTGLLPRP